MVELATALIWALRIVLPIVLFCIYFKLQAPKEESYPGPTKHQHPRSRLLGLRKHVEKGEPPPELRTMTMATQEQAPHLFTTLPRAGRRGKGEGKGDRDGERREPRPDREHREPREGREPREDRPKGEGRERRDRGERNERPRRTERAHASETRSDVIATAPVQGSDAKVVVVAQGENKPGSLSPAEEEKMHLESLINYVAFNRKEQQRTFIVDENDAPPPPPPKAPKPSDAKRKSEEKVVATILPPTVSVGAVVANITGEPAAKANAEAQMVLSGAIKFRRVDVAQKLYEQLVDQQVEISEKTFALMIESCIVASDLMGASDFLVKMEASGFSPDTALLDKVMQLYSEEKSRAKQMVENPASMTKSMFEPALAAPLLPANEDGSRTKLSSKAMHFVPSFGFGCGGGVPAVQPPPPPGPRPEKEEQQQTAWVDELDGSRTKLSSKAIVFVPSFGFGCGGGVPAVQPPPPPGPRPVKVEEGIDQSIDEILPVRRTGLKGKSANKVGPIKEQVGAGAKQWKKKGEE